MSVGSKPMSILKQASRGAAFLRRFSHDRRGVTALTFALCAMLLLAVTFAAIDAARFSAARVELQDTLDSSILAAGLTNATDSATLNKVGGAYMTGQLKASPNLLNAKATFTPGTKSVSAVATADVDPIFMDLFTHSLVHIEVHSEVVRGQDQTLELAMVLDTTGSMKGTKIDTLKTASTSLVTKVLNGNTKGEAKIAIVPFANYVNVGIASRTASWAAVDADWNEPIYTAAYTPAPVCSKTTCTGSETYACTKSSTNDGVTTTTQTYCTRGTNCTTKTLNPCEIQATKPATTTYKSHVFSGCYGSPPYPQNVRDSDFARKYPGFLDLTCSTQVTPLTYNLTTLKNAISAISAKDETYIPAGLTWGLNMLSPQAPITDAAAYDTTGPNRKPRKVLLLMTDGANTKLMNAANGKHDKSPAKGARAAQADTWTAELCANIKAQKIEVYAVAFDIGSDTVSRDLVKSCATDAAHFYDAADSTALVAAFDAIASSLQALHISK
jgi:Flp pilus assembly protein TadG